MKFTPHQLRVFECVARRLSVTKAAQELSLSQSTVSTQIKLLADEIGLPLFDPAGRSIALTEAGRELYATAQEMFDVWGRFEMRVGDLRGLKRGLLRLAVASTAKYVVPDLLGLFCAQYPEIDVRMELASRGVLLQRMREAQDDLYILVAPPEQEPCESFPFLENELVVVAPAGHALIGVKGITPARLALERLILREPGSGAREVVLRFFASRGLTPDIRMELASNEAIKHCVAAGLGISAISAHALDVDPALDHLCVLDVEGFPVRSQWYLASPAQRRLSVVAQAFKDFLLAEAPRLRVQHAAVLHRHLQRLGT